MHAGDLMRKYRDAFNRWAAPHAAPPAAASPNAVAEALKEVLGLKGLDPKTEQMLKTARLRPSKDGRSLNIMYWPK